MEKEDHLIYCPTCKSSFDVSEQMNKWKEDLEDKFIRAVKKNLEDQQ